MYRVSVNQRVAFLLWGKGEESPNLTDKKNHPFHGEYQPFSVGFEVRSQSKLSVA